MKNRNLLHNWRLCPHHCAINRFTETGYCRSSDKIKINLVQKHFGEEPVFSGTKGSGTIFFSNCNMRCVYCQNYRISQWGWGREISEEELSHEMIKLQKSGVHNINLVSPTQYTYSIVDSIQIAKKHGLEIPIIWNSNAYESVETLEMLSGVIDIFLPDLRYYKDSTGRELSGVAHYFDYASKAIDEMFRQVNHLQVKDDLAISGLLIRLLVLPNYIDEMKEIIYWIANNFGTEVHCSLMSQYYPTYRSLEFPKINRTLKAEEYEELVSLCNEMNFENCFIQELNSTSYWTPNFKEENEKRNCIS